MPNLLHLNFICIIFWSKKCMVFWQYNFLCYDNGTEQTIGDSWIYSWKIMRYLLNVCSKLLCCGCSDVWWCSEFNLFHHSDYLCPRFAKVFVWWIILHCHRSKLNGIVSMLIARSQYRPLTKAIFSSPEICGKILNIFWGGINTTKITV